MRKPRNRAGGKWVFVEDKNRDPAESEEEKMEEVVQMLTTFRSKDHPFAAVEQFYDYFPGANKVPDGGAWVLVKNSPPTEYTVPPLSIWFAEPWPMEKERHCSHRVKLVTPRGDLGLFPREYSLIEDPSKYYEFIGADMEIKFFGSDVGIPELPLFYLRSRGIGKKDAITMLVGQIKASGVCWIETREKIAAQLGMQWPSKERNATLFDDEKNVLQSAAGRLKIGARPRR